MSKKNRSGRADRHFIHDSLERALRSRGHGRGPWQGVQAEQALPAMRDAVQQLLEQELGRCRTIEAVRWAASVLAMSEDGREQAKAAGGAQAFSALNAHTENAASARIALQLAARSGVSGHLPVDSTMALRLAILSRTLWQTSLVAERLRNQLYSVSHVHLERDGELRVTVEDRPPFRWSQFELAYARRTVTDRDEPDADAVQQLLEAVKEGGSIPARFEGVDDGLRRARGHGLLALLGALTFLERWAGGDDVDSAGKLSESTDLRRSMVATLGSWYPHLDGEEVASTLGWSTWTQQLLHDTPLQIERGRHVAARLYSRPVIELPTGELFVPRRAPAVSQTVLMHRIIEGNWYEELGPSDGPLKRALDHRRNRIRPIEGFESDVSDRLAAIGMPHACSVTESTVHPSTVLGVAIRREIDAVVIDEARRLVWVVEAKDLAFPFAAKKVPYELAKYFDPGGHQDKLREKCEDVRAAPETVARHLGASDPDGQWLVDGVFVTREPSPASCDDRAQFRFVMLSELDRFLASGGVVSGSVVTSRRDGDAQSAVGLCALRAAAPEPMFLFEAVEPVLLQAGSEPVTGDVAAMLSGGWGLAPTGNLNAIRPPYSEDLAVLIEDGQITIWRPSVPQFPLFAGALPPPPPGWLRRIQEVPAVMLVSGAGLGLDDGPGLEQRLDRAAKAGNLCAVIAGVARTVHPD
jgi:hypothetical protein